MPVLALDFVRGSFPPLPQPRSFLQRRCRLLVSFPLRGLRDSETVYPGTELCRVVEPVGDQRKRRSTVCKPSQSRLMRPAPCGNLTTRSPAPLQLVDWFNETGGLMGSNEGFFRDPVGLGNTACW